MKHSNCLIEAIRIWLQRRNGYIKCRLSRHGRIPHFIYESPTGKIIQFVPVNEIRLTFKNGLRCLMFEGEYVYGDEAYRCHVQLQEWGVDESELKDMTDQEVIVMHHRVVEARERMGGDPT